MKFTFAFFAICACLLVLTQAKPQEYNPFVVATNEFCPSKGDCEEYAQQQLKDGGFCRNYRLIKDSINYIEWRFCDTIICPDNKKTEEDLSKPFPDCCAKCA